MHPHLPYKKAGSHPLKEKIVKKEEEFLEKQKQDPQSPYHTPVKPHSRSRRGFIASTAALIGGGLATGTAALAEVPAGAIEREVPEDPAKAQGVGVGADDGGYGTRSQFETEIRERFETSTVESSWSFTPLHKSHGIITPSGLHFERHHGGIATIDPNEHELYVHGMVKQPKKFSMNDVQRFPFVSRIMFIECSGNGLTEWIEPTMKTVQGTHGLTSTSEWTGIKLSTLLNEVGVRPEAKWVLAEGGDSAVMTRSIPIEKAMKDCILAYGQNGEAIRPEQGYPLRLIVPGYEGNMSIKWLRRLQLADEPFMTREETSKYTDLMPDGKALQFTFLMEPKSVITFPSGEMLLDGPGFYNITGLAWSGNGKIERVEVSTDGGKNWHAAHLHGPILPISHTRFSIPWQWDGKRTVLQSRCIDEYGNVQPTIKHLIDERGTNGPQASVYHNNGIQSWLVDSTGEVSNVHHF